MKHKMLLLGPFMQEVSELIRLPLKYHFLELL